MLSLYFLGRRTYEVKYDAFDGSLYNSFWKEIILGLYSKMTTTFVIQINEDDYKSFKVKENKNYIFFDIWEFLFIIIAFFFLILCIPRLYFHKLS